MYTKFLQGLVTKSLQLLIASWHVANISFQKQSRAALQWRDNCCDGVSNYRRLDCLLERLFRRRSKKTSKLRVTGLCEDNSTRTGEFPSQMANNAENVFIWWRNDDSSFYGNPLRNILAACVWITRWWSRRVLQTHHYPIHNYIPPNL